MKKTLKIVAVIGFVLGGALGMLGTMVTSQNVRAISWAVDGTALIVATSILALMYFRKGCDGIATVSWSTPSAKQSCSAERLPASKPASLRSRLERLCGLPAFC